MGKAVEMNSAKSLGSEIIMPVLYCLKCFFQTVEAAAVFTFKVFVLSGLIRCTLSVFDIKLLPFQKPGSDCLPLFVAILLFAPRDRFFACLFLAGSAFGGSSVV